MKTLPARITTWLCLLLLSVATPSLLVAGDTDGEKAEVEETIEVKRAKTQKTKHPSLRFLNDHRVFLRAQLDLLRLQITRVKSDDAEMIDERWLRWKEMAAAIAVARDTVRAEHEATPERELLSSVTELAELEAELNLMEKILVDQRHRLLLLEEDFLGSQETALVVLIKGLSDKEAPVSIELREESDVVTVSLTAEQQASLERGGIAQIYHEFVEPREHVFTVRFAGNAWDETNALAVTFEAARDRLTFLELDLSQLDRDGEALGLLTSVWYR